MKPLHIHIILTIISALLAVAGCSHGTSNPYTALTRQLSEYIADKDASIGVAVIVDGTDTVHINGHSSFPMLSVYKFPQALAIADYCTRAGITFSDTICYTADEIKENTWSPMRDKYGAVDQCLSLGELLAYTMQQSDNNACDILFRYLGSPTVADSVIKTWGYHDINIISTEAQMHSNPELCYLNSATPLAMASLLDHFNTNLKTSSEEYKHIARLMEQCATGTDRLAPPLQSTGAILGHKTGTGDTDSHDRIIAVNDCGYVNLPTGHHYTIAVFITNSAYNMPTTTRLITDIAYIVYATLKK